MLGPRIIAQIVSTLGLVGLLLAVVGLYGVVAYSVSRRTHEIGIRIAIGALPRDVLTLVLRQGLAFTAIGVPVGIAIALLSGRVVQKMVVGVSFQDPLILAGVPAVLVGAMLAACWLPARRASRVDPLRALRQD